MPIKTWNRPVSTLRTKNIDLVYKKVIETINLKGSKHGQQHYPGNANDWLVDDGGTGQYPGNGNNWYEAMIGQQDYPGNSNNWYVAMVIIGTRKW